MVTAYWDGQKFCLTDEPLLWIASAGIQGSVSFFIYLNKKKYHSKSKFNYQGILPQIRAWIIMTQDLEPGRVLKCGIRLQCS